MLRRWRRALMVWIWLLLLAGSSAAQAHGGGMVLRQSQGDYEVIAVLSPNPPAVGPADLRLTFRQIQASEPVPMSRVLVEIDDPTDALSPAQFDVPPEGHPQQAIYGTHQLSFPHAGEWQLRVVGVREGSQVDLVMMVEVVEAGTIQWLEIIVYSLPLVVFLGLIVFKMWYTRRLQQSGT